MSPFQRYLFVLASVSVVILSSPATAALGHVDPGFNPAVNGAITLFVPQTDGKILMTGGFTEVDGVPRKGFARLNSDGTLDPRFPPQNPTAFPPVCVAVHADGRILADVPATGRSVSVPGCSFYEYDLKWRVITAGRIYFDFVTLLRQIGTKG